MSGFGDAASGFIKGIQLANAEQDKTERTRILAEESEQRGEFRQKQMAQMDYNLKQSKLKDAEYNSSAATQLRSRVLTAKLQSIKSLFGDSSSSGAGQQAQLQQEVTANTQALGDITAQTTSIRSVGNVVSTLGSGGTNTDFEDLASTMLNDSDLAGLAPNGLTIYNPNSVKHKQGIYSFAMEALKLEGVDLSKADEKTSELILGDAINTANKLAERGFLGFDPITGDAIDIVGMFGATDIISKLPQGQMTAYNKEGRKVAGQAKKDYQREREVKKLASESAAWERQAKQYKTPGGTMVDATVAKQQYELLGMSVPPDLTKLLNENVEAEKVAKTTDTYEDLGAMMLAISGGKGSDELIAKARTGISTLSNDTEKKKWSERLERAERISFVNETLKKEDITVEEEKTLERFEDRAGKEFTGLDKQRAVIRKEMQLADAVDGVITEVGDVLGYEGLVAGAGANYVLGLVAEDKTKAAEMYNGLMDKVNKGKGKITKAQILNTIGINTKLGKLVASYIKTESGMGVSDNEREFLIGILAGAMNGNPEEMVKALTSFRDVTIGSVNQQFTSDYRMPNRMPKTAWDAKKQDEKYTPYEELNFNYGNTSSPGKLNSGTTVPDQQGNKVPKKYLDRL